MEFAGKRIIFSGFSFWIALALVALYLLIPFQKTIKMGIDLVGGTHITLEVQAEKAVESELLQKSVAISNKLYTANEVLPTGKEVKNMQLNLTFETSDQAESVALFLSEHESELQQKISDNIIHLFFTDTKANRIMRDAVDRNVEVLRSRVDKIGISETPVFAQGDRNIVVELPAVDNPQEAKKIIGKAAMLEFKIVEHQASSEDDLLYEYDGKLPDDLEIVPGQMKSNGHVEMYYVVPRYTEMTGRLLRDARPELQSEIGQMVVTFEWTPEGGDKFYELTSRNTHRQLAVILDGAVMQAPTISCPIRNSGYISGGFTPKKAKELSLLLKSGAFVAPVTFEEERQVGPTLGAASIKRGLLSCLAGLLLIFLLSIFYYRLAGLFAFFALLLNLLFTLFILSRLGATLTLPGIAGLIVTLGMAIDAAILIFERVKEELALGVDIRRAVSQGFSNALSVILDGNITTFLIVAVLYKFGTGPVQGFAVTIMVGILATLITSLFFLRSLFMLVLNNIRIKKLSI